VRIVSTQSCILGAALFIVGCGEEGIPSPPGEGNPSSSRGGTTQTKTGPGTNAGATGGSSTTTIADASGGRTVSQGGGGNALNGGSTTKTGTAKSSLGTGGRATTTGATTGVGTTNTGTQANIPSTCAEAQKTLSSNGTGQHCGYTYEYWKDSGNGSLVLKADGFSVDWSNINNLLGRKGVRPGTGKEVVTYESNYQPNGNSYLCIYGWFRNPLVEYYIVDSWGDWRPPGGQGLQGSVTCDGGEYDLYKVARTGPSIDGNGPFTQYWSVRKQRKVSGTLTVGCHFDAWKAKGMTIGSMYEVSVTVEGYQSTGKADVKFVIK
jgi:endo-1,4-beta-xylanase